MFSGWDTEVCWRRLILAYKNPLFTYPLTSTFSGVTLIIWSQQGKSANTTNLLVSSQAAKGIRTFTLVPGRSKLEPICPFSCTRRKHGNHPHRDRLGVGKRTNVQSHALGQALRSPFIPKTQTHAWEIALALRCCCWQNQKPMSSKPSVRCYTLSHFFFSLS